VPWNSVVKAMGLTRLLKLLPEPDRPDTAEHMHFAFRHNRRI